MSGHFQREAERQEDEEKRRQQIEDDYDLVVAELQMAGAVQTPQGWRWPFYLADGKVMQMTVEEWVAARRNAAEVIASQAAEVSRLRAALERIVAHADHGTLAVEYEGFVATDIESAYDALVAARAALAGEQNTQEKS